MNEKALQEYATEKGREIVIRSYDNRGNSDDTRRASTSVERPIITSIILGSLLAIDRGGDVQSIKDAAEFIGKLLIPEMNGFNTIYIPIGEFDWKASFQLMKLSMKMDDETFLTVGKAYMVRIENKTGDRMAYLTDDNGEEYYTMLTDRFIPVTNE